MNKYTAIERRMLIAQAELEELRRKLMEDPLPDHQLRERCDCCRQPAYAFGFKVSGPERLCKYHWLDKIKFDNIGVSD